MRVEITVGAVFDLLHLVLADLHQRLGYGGQLRGRRVKDYAVVEDPLRSSQEGLGGTEALLLDILLHGAQIHGTGDIVLVGREVGGVDRFSEGLHPGHCLHPAQGVFEQNTELVDL